MRWNMIVNPLKFICSSDNQIEMSLFEQIAVILRYPSTIASIKNPYALTQYLYCVKESTDKINMCHITNERAVKRALKRNYNLILRLDILKYEDLIFDMLEDINASYSSNLLARLLVTDGISDDIRRKIFILNPQILDSYIIRRYLINEDTHNDLLEFIIRNHLDEMLYAISGHILIWDRILLERVLKTDLSLFYKVIQKTDFDSKILVDIILDNLKNKIITYTTINSIKNIIDYDNSVFNLLIKTIYKNGLIQTYSIVVSDLLSHHHELIDDELAELIVDFNVLK